MIHGTREEQLQYMRDYHLANWERLREPSAERYRMWKARKKRQAVVIGEVLDAFERFERAKKCEELRREVKFVTTPLGYAAIYSARRR